jgi:glycerophosphoryl diester phosphodiesterase
MQLITHRAIDVDLGDTQGWALQESRWESFLEQIRAGWGLEFDVQLLSDGRFAISHDSSLARIVPGCNKTLSSLSTDDLRSIAVPNGRLCSLEELLSLIAECGRSISALHLKNHCQEIATLERILDAMSPKIDSLIGRLLIFDAKPQVAAQIMQRFPGLDVAASVAHPFDVLRYGAITGGTLLTPQEVFANRHLYSWVWLDEWDTLGADSVKKTFVNSDSVNFFKNLGLKVAAVSPELHAISPALLGGEKHEDGVDEVRLVRRWQQWSQLGVDALCTDHASWISTNLQPLLLSEM